MGASTFQSVTLPLTDLGTLITVDHAFVDFRGVAHTALGRTVEVSDAKHAGLTMAVATGFL